ncbi:DUF2388 domain-containing protein [Pseudomonas sp. N40(2020)]|uniref:DUF2388 domain-containing protein n=1 Tax=Pseudomonas sp. N40(2020) TaxID=2767798 RepID=UPI001656A3FC|nr:DUF2388 domain-containing protein [Pseudomonas sp. N40(2020)]MBC8995997.1 DUF2388 domain-containing protein [Pseudomonas sp. N40(2020)]
MPAFSRVLFKRFTLLALLSTLYANAYASCDFAKGCGDGEDGPFQSTQMSGFLVFTGTLVSFDGTSNVSGLNKRVYSVEEIEAARYYLASDGMLQAAYFTSALQRFRQAAPDSELNDLAVAALISSE